LKNNWTNPADFFILATMSVLSQKQKNKIAQLAGKKTAGEIARSLHVPEPAVSEFLQTAKAAQRRRERWFKIIVLALPLLFFVAVELVLCGLNYGGNLSLFIPLEAAPGYWRVNPQVGLRYFANLRVAPETSNDVFTAYKAAGTYRIFVLGGSSAYGYPFGHNGSLSKFLLQRLQAHFPEKRLEIVNLAMPAINSFSLLDMLAEALQQRPDALVIYAGHNEYYGALGVGSTESLGQSRAMIRLYLKLQNFRTFLFLRRQIENLKRWFAKKSANAEADGATLMERMVGNKTIPFGSTTYHRGVEFFRQNLRELGQRAQEQSVPVYFCTLVSNLRDQAPFVSLASGEIDSVRLRTEMQKGRELEKTGAFAEALAIYQKLAEQEKVYAELYYRLGKCCEALQRVNEAQEFYQHARDLDALRFRAPTVFNTVIHEVAAATDNPLVQVDSAFAGASPQGLMGNNLFLEHLHPNLQGYFMMAREIAMAMQREGAIARVWPNSAAMPDSALWQQRAVTPLDLEVAKIRIGMLTSRWPFVPERMQGNFQYQAQDEIQRHAKELWQKNMTWEQAHVKAAEFYAQQGDLRSAAREYEALILETPYNVSPYLRAGLIYVAMGEMAAAKKHFTASLAISETAEAHENLGAILLQEKNVNAALPHLERALQTQPNDPELLYNLTGGYLMAGKADQAEATLRQLERLRPNSVEVAALKNDLLNLRRFWEKRGEGQ
jgi:tetratricopeptide (TPR) repeat protein